jgi:hypothetical protein
LDVDAGIAERYPDHMYIRDLGIRWNVASSGRQLISGIGSKQWPTIYLLTHPDYWSGSPTRAMGLQVAARLVRGFRLNAIIAAGRSMLLPRKPPPDAS